LWTRCRLSRLPKAVAQVAVSGHAYDAQQQREPQGGPRKHVADSGIESGPRSQWKICEYPVHLLRPGDLLRNQPAVGVARGQQTMTGRACNSESILNTAQDRHPSVNPRIGIGVPCRDRHQPQPGVRVLADRVREIHVLADNHGLALAQQTRGGSGREFSLERHEPVALGVHGVVTIWLERHGDVARWCALQNARDDFGTRGLRLCRQRCKSLRKPGTPSRQALSARGVGNDTQHHRFGPELFGGN
jgi:hypothetical protein